MNNSFNVDLSEDFSQEKPDPTPLREREAKLVRILEALSALSQSNEWSTLKTELFDEILKNVENQMRMEAEKSDIRLPELYRLQGERKWAKRYADPISLIENYRVELAHIRMQLNPPAERV